MNDARIAELLEPFLGDDGRSTAALSLAQVRLISMYVDLLLRWNDRVNLTAIRKPGEIITRHFGESLFAARQLFPQPEVETGTTAQVIDIGSGAGFPGLPAKIWAPHIRLTLIESNQKEGHIPARGGSPSGPGECRCVCRARQNVPWKSGRCGDVSRGRAIRNGSSGGCRFSGTQWPPGSSRRKITTGSSPAALAGPAVERSDPPATFIQPLTDHWR